MLSVAEAESMVLDHTQPLPSEVVGLQDLPFGAVLAEDITADIDMPPFDKAMMDGFAVRSADLHDGKAKLRIVEEITAGTVPTRAIASGEAARIMTGAQIPPGADAVIMVERTTVMGDHVLIDDSAAKVGANILRRGREIRSGEIVLKAGTKVRPQEIGLLASVGRTQVRVHCRPVVAILATGDELVDPQQTPGPGQIRNSNGPMLVAQVQRAGGVVRCVGIAKDNVDDLRAKISEGLTGDILILSGGVSAGKLDLVPGVLQELGIEPQFHKILMKPGKPAFFGKLGTKLVFGLPGNPVSSFVCFELFVRPAMRKLQNHPQPLPPIYQAALMEDVQYSTDRPTYHPAQIQFISTQLSIHLLPWFGSSDLRGLSGANALALIEPGHHKFHTGQNLKVLPLDYE